MRNIFLGALLIFLDLSISPEGFYIDFLPDFIGGILIYLNVKSLSDKSPMFEKATSIAKGVSIYYAIIFFLNISGIINSIPIFLNSVLGIISTVVFLYLFYFIVKGIEHLEKRFHTPLNTEKLSPRWKCITVTGGTLCVLTMLSYLHSIFSVIAGILLLADFVFYILFLIALYQSQKLYHNALIC